MLISVDDLRAVSVKNAKMEHVIDISNDRQVVARRRDVLSIIRRANQSQVTSLDELRPVRAVIRFFKRATSSPFSISFICCVSSPVSW